MEAPFTDWLAINNSEVLSRLGKVTHILFDFDGTLSVLRQGWENVMIPMMIKAICGNFPISNEIQEEVIYYVDQSTGILTIKQMQWLVDAVRRHNLNGSPLTAEQYKAIYLKNLMVSVYERIEKVEEGEISPDSMMIFGTLNFIRQLTNKSVKLYLSSGTDHAYVLREAQVLGIAPEFNGGIFGALDDIEAHDKGLIIQRILSYNGLSGNQLAVIGDGPVEIIECKQRNGIAIGVASDEERRYGWNNRKFQRLLAAGADILIADFTHYPELTELIAGK